MTTVEYLRLAREKVASGWCTGALARDDDGNEVDPTAPAAMAWSIYGALLAVGRFAFSDQNNVEAYSAADDALILASGTRSGLASWNDTQTRESVLRCFDRAIASEEGKDDVHARRT